MSDARLPVIVTVVFGDHHHLVAGWTAHLRNAGCVLPVHLIVLDGREPSVDDPAVSVEHATLARPVWGSGDYVRLERIRELCASGRTCLQIDLDTYFNVDPAAYVGLPFGLIVSRGLGYPEAAIRTWGFSLCTGFYIAKPQALGLLDDWIAQRPRRRGLDQEDLNLRLIETGVRWRHVASPLVTDAFVAAEDSSLCVLPDRAITRDSSFASFGAVHNRSLLTRHLCPAP